MPLSLVKLEILCFYFGVNRDGLSAGLSVPASSFIEIPSYPGLALL